VNFQPTVDPQIRRMLEILAAMGRPSLANGEPEEARAAFRGITVDARRPEHVVPVASVRDLLLDGAEGPLAARHYAPDDPAPRPTVVFFHGGGFVFGDLDTHDNQCRWICREVGADVLSIAYRLAPEHPWPAAVDDCFAATRWAAAHVAELGGDPERLAVAGDSAGGNLAAVTAIRCRDAGGPKLAAQLLLYPSTDSAGGDAEYPSRVENAEGYFLTRSDMAWFDRQYAVEVEDRADPLLSPIHAVHEGLPPAVIATAEFDPLRDEGESYAYMLGTSSVDVTPLRFDGMIHGFFDFAGLSPGAERAIRATLAPFKALLA
jgi:acetyl esterase